MDEIINENGLESNIPDLPPDNKPIQVKKIVADIIEECNGLKAKEAAAQNIAVAAADIDINDDDEKEPIVQTAKVPTPNSPNCDDQKDEIPLVQNAELKKVDAIKDEDDEKKQTMDVYSMLFDAMKDDKNANVAKEDSPKIPIESLMQIETGNKSLKASSDDSFIAKVN